MILYDHLEDDVCIQLYPSLPLPPAFQGECWWWIDPYGHLLRNRAIALRTESKPAESSWPWPFQSGQLLSRVGKSIEEFLNRLTGEWVRWLRQQQLIGGDSLKQFAALLHTGSDDLIEGRRCEFADHRLPVLIDHVEDSVAWKKGNVRPCNRV